MRRAMSKNLTVLSLLLTTMRGSAALSFGRARFIEVSMTELLIEQWSRLYLLSHSRCPKPRERLRVGRVEVGEEVSVDWKHER